MLLIGCLIWGVAGTVAFNAVAVTSIKELGAPWGQLFYILLAIGAAVPLAGIIRTGVVGAYIERSGLLILSGMNLAFAIAVVFTAFPRGLGFTLLMTCLGVANLVRWWQIPREIDRLTKAAAASQSVDQLGD